MMRGRDLGTAALVALVVLAVFPAYDELFEDALWRGPTLSVVALSLLICVGVRALRGGAIIAVLVAGLTATAVLPWLLGLSPTAMLPGPEAIGLLGEVAAQAPELVAETPAPVPALPGLVLVVLVAWWVVVHTAHELAVRLQQPSAALVTLVVLWAVPLVVVGGDGVRTGVVAPFLIAALLAALLTGRTDARARGAPLRGVAVAGMATVVALLAPGIAPGFDSDGWLDLGGTSQPRGYQPIVDVSQRLGLPEERDVLRVRSSQRSYLRLAGLDRFDGATWRLGATSDGGTYRPDPASLYTADGLLPPEQPSAATQTVLMDVEVLELENIYVPVPYQPVEILGPIREEMVWSTEGGFLATWETVDRLADGEPRIGIREGVEYRVQAARPAPTFDELRAVDFDAATIEQHTELPREYPELGELAREVYADADAATFVEQALALQDWFVGPDGGFTYDLDVPALRGDDALTDFVLEDRVGYCEYFATAMAVMLRETGIPARVAVGFLPGRVTEDADPASGAELTEYTVSTADAHAWVEVLFPGYGWITFEPTPRDDDSHILPTSDDIAPIENVEERAQREAEESPPDDTDTESPDVDVPEGQDPSEVDVPEQDQDAAAPGEGTTPTPVLPTIVVALLAIAALALIVATRRGPQEEPDAIADVLVAQRDLLRVAERVGAPRRRAETLPEVVDRWVAEARVSRPDRTLTAVTQAAAFGGRVSTEDASRATRQLRQLEEELRGSVEGRDRALAPIRIPARRLKEFGQRAWSRTDRLRAATRR
ncbi:MAG: transglutaminase domain-containing protein [Nitriliruptoraceae bacterium]|nr:transglutaminase domain-containing protein [Nitriliruptoraceae bacterium]